MKNSRALHDELKHIVGETGILPEAEIADYSFDGYVPKAVVLPVSVQEVQGVLRFASKKALSVIPAGAGTKLGLGNLPQKVDIVLATPRLNSVVEYEPADLTVTVEAGIRLATLQAELAQHRQFLPLDPAYSDRCTIGGIVSANASGPLRLRHGTARNQVLGLRVVHANGTVVKSGGKVVKNVAGYDLNKLYIGAFGTLGIVTEVTLKLSPIPQREAILTAGFENVQDAVETGLNIVSSQTLPMFVNLLTNFGTDRVIDTKRPTLVVGFGGDPETVTWQLERCQEKMEQNGAKGVTLIEGEAQQHLRAAVREFAVSDEKVIAKLNLKRTDIAEFAAQAVAEGSDYGVEVMALLGSGVLYLAIPIAPDTDFQTFAKHLTKLRQSATEARGNLIVEKATPELKQHIDVWGSFGDAAGLMKQVKVRFDPTGLLNPGRLISGI